MRYRPKKQMITQERFNTVIHLLSKSDDLEHIAIQAGMTKSSVKLIRQEKTWEEHLRRKAVKAAKVREAKSRRSSTATVPTVVTATPQPQKPVFEEDPRYAIPPVSLHVLNDAYLESKEQYEKVATALVDVREDLADIKLSMRTLLHATASLQRADVRRTVHENQSWWRRMFGRGKEGL
ncbi:hypothetical protein RR21198_4858 [Rhodococcus rhodochrous ATCC 21198]|nr:hypothetical protein RR21198_4858 [Rhodococcus rhodochrous ATCC 21198]